MLDALLLCLAFGCVSGMLAGLFGLGGGLVLVPFFLVLFEFQGVASELLMLMAVATSLATIVVTSIAATFMQYRLGVIVWRYVFNLGAGIVIGVILGAWVADTVSDAHLRLFFALYMLYTAIKMARQSSLEVGHNKLKILALRLSGAFIGFIASILGIGGGTMIVPLLARHQVPMRNAVAISSACGLPVAIIGTLSYAFLGWRQAGLPEGSLGYVYLPAFFGIVISSVVTAPMGAQLANSLPTKRLKRYFSLLLFVVAGKILWALYV